MRFVRIAPWSSCGRRRQMPGVDRSERMRCPRTALSVRVDAKRAIQLDGVELREEVFPRAIINTQRVEKEEG